MDTEKTKRKSLRQSFTVCANNAKAALDKADTTVTELSSLQRQLLDKYSRLEEVQEIVAQSLLTDPSKTTEYENDFETAEKYRDTFADITTQLEARINIAAAPSESGRDSTAEKTQFQTSPFGVKEIYRRPTDEAVAVPPTDSGAEGAGEQGASTRSLERLMTFLRAEVQSEEMIVLARAGLGATQLRVLHERRVEEPSLPTNAVLVNTGIDLAGPLFLRSGEKVWIVLYTCAVFRAVHLELVTALSTESFMLYVPPLHSAERKTENCIHGQWN
ncbi:hypothetical protein JTE90_008900 [Oedothorax gibbosus]|uniref:Uncharacterized protein n=1 Tax=Oedothorax gibbosus TaxID=931172 RepID=A0AAV6UIQ0_9ARAC|nr:hypothetical protein JTE90_008900 [Oedothorax gibbosus]